MRVTALIDHPQLIRRILERPGCWAPEASGPATPEPEWPLNAVILRTDHPVTDIA